MTLSSPKRPNPLAIAGVSVWVGLLLLLSHWMGQQAYHWLPVQASNAAPLVDGLFSFETAIGTFVFAGVVSVLVWVVLVHRADKYDESDAEPLEGNPRLEVVWTAIPFLLVMAIAYYAIQVNSRLGLLGPMEHIHSHDSAELAVSSGGVANAGAVNDDTIEVIARQWSWEFRYPLSHVSSTELHLTVDQPVTFRLVSEDVLHGFYIPAFRLKQDIVPGRAITFRLTPTREGRYRLRDSQFSGTWFAANQADVVVESPQSHDQWLKEASSTPLQPGLSQASMEYSQRSQEGSRGWATVIPAPPPQVNVVGQRDAPHEA